MKPYLLAIDIGTSGAKVLALHIETGRTHTASASYPTHTPGPGCAEQYAPNWWKAACDAIQQLLHTASIRAEDICAVGVDGTSWASVWLDRTGQVLEPTLLWYDTRARAESDAIAQGPHAHALRALCGNPLEPYYALPKFHWQQKHSPKAADALHQILSSNGYIVYRLTDESFFDRCQAYGWCFFDMKNGRWDESAMQSLGMDAAWLPPLAECTDVVGQVTRRAAAECGLQPGTPVVAGGLDAACGAVGAGVIGPGATHEQSGSAGGMSICCSSCQPAQGLILSRHVVPGRWLLQGGTVGGGGLVRWMEDVFFHSDHPSSADERRQRLTEIAASAPPGCEGVLFLPYMAGERTPIWNPSAKGVFYGLDFTKKQAHLLRAVLEGAAFALQHNLNTAREAGAHIGELRAVGGASANQLWMQIKADVTGQPIRAVSGGEATGVGCAIVAGVGCGAFSSFEEACARYVRLEPVYTPNPNHRALYDSLYEQYLLLYQSLKTRMEG